MDDELIDAKVLMKDGLTFIWLPGHPIVLTAKMHMTALRLGKQHLRNGDLKRIPPRKTNVPTLYQ